MKKIITYFTAAILSVTILAASPGVSIYKMQCLSGNFSSTSFYAPVKCSSTAMNKEQDKHGNLSSKCCDFSVDYVQLKVLSHFSFIKSPVPMMFDLACAFVQQFFAAGDVVTIAESFHISSSPPVFPDLLLLIGALLI